MKTTYSAAEARSNFSEILSQVAFAKSSVIIKRYGEPIAKIMPAAADMQMSSKRWYIK